MVKSGGNWLFLYVYKGNENQKLAFIDVNFSWIFGTKYYSFCNHGVVRVQARPVRD